jgi:hypothetical protein
MTRRNAVARFFFEHSNDRHPAAAPLCSILFSNLPDPDITLDFPQST